MTNKQKNPPSPLKFLETEYISYLFIYFGRAAIPVCPFLEMLRLN